MVHLFDLPHAEARKLLETGAPVYLTVNPVEYHGPHLSLHNDRLVSHGLIGDLHARLARRHPDWPLILGADLEVGVGATSGRGTRHSSYSLTRTLVGEACRALAELGARRVVLMTFHGDPLHGLALDYGIRLLAARGVYAVGPFPLLSQQLVVGLDSVPLQAFAHVADEAERQAMVHDRQRDFHAGFFETSLALLYAPDSVAPAYVDLPPCPPFSPDRLLLAAARGARACGFGALAAELDFAATAAGWFRLSPFPGYSGRPHRATRDSGRVIADLLLDLFEPAVEAVLTGKTRPPLPIMRWLPYVTLGGRLGGMRVSPQHMEGIDAVR